MTKPTEITDVAVRRQGKFLVVTNRKHPDGYTCPGGKLEATDKTPAHGAARELREEVGLHVDPETLQPIGHFDFRWRGTPLRCFAFELPEEAWEGQTPQAMEAGTRVLWVARDDLVDVASACLSPAFYGWLMAKQEW